MVKLGKTSFRRILLSRILLLSVPVLLLGELVTLRKARSSLLETARKNLTESAVRKGESIRDAIQALQANLLIASETTVLQYGSPAELQAFLDQLSKRLPSHVQCIQLSNIETGNVVASTCGTKPIVFLPLALWPPQQSDETQKVPEVHLSALLPENSRFLGSEANNNDKQRPETQLRLVASAPVYIGGNDWINPSQRELRYALSVQSALHQYGGDEPGSLTGYTVVIAQDGRILAHPNSDRVGESIQDEPDAQRLESLVKNAIAGRQDFLHLFSFDRDGVELLAGYTAIPSPVMPQDDQQWVILAVTRLDNALAGMKEIQQVMVQLILCLLAANLLATLYLARDLARPIEQLVEYALNVQCRHDSPDRVPSNFQIREFNQLAEALNRMVERLKSWAEELETAWKEAKTANQLKNEFLATTSHELRTPLNAIIGSIRLVRDGCCDDAAEEMEFLQRADDAAIHLLDIINDVLDIAKIEAGTLSVAVEPVILQDVIREAIDLQIAQMQHNGLQLNLRMNPEPLMVEADPAKLKQIFLNIVGNAIKFTDSGSITIATRKESTKALEKEIDGPKSPELRSSLVLQLQPFTSYVIVTIRDTGIGIDPQQQHRLFQPFVMIDGTRTRKHGGTGLGLAISRNLIELMGGFITLYSGGIGKGTTVEIAVPTIDVARSHHGNAEETAELSQIKPI